MESYLKEELALNYLDLCNFLQSKYGVPSGNYFLTESCKSKNQKITRGNDGLFIHHIKENEYIQLCDPRIAVHQPFEYQKAQNLCYCNYLEHLILHFKIVQEYLIEENILKCQCFPGIGGIINFIVPEINDYFNGYPVKQPWKLKAFSLVDKQSFEELKALIFNSMPKTFKQESFDVLKRNKGFSQIRENK